MTNSYPIIAKRGHADCAVAALAMAFRLDYHDALVAAIRINPYAWSAGLTAAEVLYVTSYLGHRCEWRTLDALDVRDTGVLWLGQYYTPAEHCVFAYNGLIFDPDHDPVLVSPATDYLERHEAFGHLLLKEV